MKNVKNLQGARTLNKKEQQSINGGRKLPCPGGSLACVTDQDCHNGCPCFHQPGELCGVCLSPNP
jgi:hypothetical protein